MIRKVKYELGCIASKMWNEAKALDDKDNHNVMANMRKRPFLVLFWKLISSPAVRQDETSQVCMNEEQIVSQMRTVLSAGYETVSAIVAVSRLNQAVVQCSL